MNIDTQLRQVLGIAIAAGKEILDVYERDFAVDYKGDGSPLTAADRRSHELICNELARLTPQLPVISEESSPEVLAMRASCDRYWLVDPLDGTREFIRRNDEFTVNIALIESGQPQLGVVHTPVQGISHCGSIRHGAFKQYIDGRTESISVRAPRADSVTVVASRSQGSKALTDFIERLGRCFANVDIARMGSSLKICLVAEGSADIYPRLGLTSEWDTAAAHGVLQAAGGQICDLQGHVLQYSKENVLNPWFLAGSPGINWQDFIPAEIVNS